MISRVVLCCVLTHSFTTFAQADNPVRTTAAARKTPNRLAKVISGRWVVVKDVQKDLDAILPNPADRERIKSLEIGLMDLKEFWSDRELKKVHKGVLRDVKKRGHTIVAAGGFGGENEHRRPLFGYFVLTESRGETFLSVLVMSGGDGTIPWRLHHIPGKKPSHDLLLIEITQPGHDRQVIALKREPATRPGKPADTIGPDESSPETRAAEDIGPALRKTTARDKTKETANTPQALVKQVAAAYKKGDQKTLASYFHTPDAKTREIADLQSQVALIAPKLDGFIKLSISKFGRANFEATAAESNAFSMSGRDATLWWPNFAEPNKITFDSKGDIAVGTHLNVEDGLRIHTQIRMRRVNGRWYLDVNRQGWMATPKPETLKALTEFTEPALWAAEKSKSFDQFEKAIMPLMTKLDKDSPLD